MTFDDAVPTLTPTDVTYRVGWEVIEQMPDIVTVQIRRVAPVDDSDGVPQLIGHETSLRGVIAATTAATNGTYQLNAGEKITVLMALCELAFRHGHGEIMEYPILVPDGGVRILVLKWQRFTRWFLALATFEFDEVRRELRNVPHRTRAGGLSFLADLARVIPSLRQFEDCPHLLLQL